MAIEVTAALMQRDTLAGAEDKALVAFTTFRAWSGTVLRGRQVRAGVRTATGTYRVMAEAGAPHGRHWCGERKTAQSQVSRLESNHHRGWEKIKTLLPYHSGPRVKLRWPLTGEENGGDTCKY